MPCGKLPASFPTYRPSSVNIRPSAVLFLPISFLTLALRHPKSPTCQIKA